MRSDETPCTLVQNGDETSGKEGKVKLWSGNTGLPEMTTKSSVRPILTINVSVLLRISKSTHRSSRSTHSLESGDIVLSEMTTKSNVRPILTINGSVLPRISKSIHRSSRSTHSPQNQIMEVGILSSHDPNKIDFDSYWFSLALNFDEYTSQFSLYAFFGSNREESIFKLRSGDTRLRERTTKADLRPTFTVTSSVVFWTSTRELRKFHGGYSCKY
ncbi:hypothetical protein HZH68_008435 [Vespula germanica]|uniref:Uncharacterized protein n=1 Tax=Vespula germanica TaxID=30212 RepID=A0A834JZ79_VESGE|nr:hypothetical protein HZH68_008435 [Vespula germanica]